MTIYYLDPDASGNDDGTTQANAWSTLQRAIDGAGGTQPAAGDIIHCRHGTGNDETPSAKIDFDGNVGNQTNGWIQFIGLNSSWIDDGTRYIIEGSSVAAGPVWEFLNAGNNFLYFKNFELNNAAEDALGQGASYPEIMIFDNCIFDNPTNSCLDEYLQKVLWYRCQFTGAGAYGVYRPWAQAFLFCVFVGNTSDGIAAYHDGNIYYGCIYHNNGGNGIKLENIGSVNVIQAIFNCISDGNTGDGIHINASPSQTLVLPVGCRLTNNQDGIDDDDDGYLLVELYNFFLNNSSDAKEVTNESPISGRGSLSAGTEGYNDRANDDFNLTSSATLRRTAIDLQIGT